MAEEYSETYSQAEEQFILLWSEMASSWGINKTMAQIHALLYARAEPLDTDSIMNQLGISRGNANMNLRNLLQWKLVHKIHIRGERKDYYQAEGDVWNIVAIIVRERRQREIAPIRNNLEQNLEKFSHNPRERDEESAFRERIEEFIAFLEMFERFTDALLPYINRENLPFLKKLVKMAEAHQTLKSWSGQPPETGKQS
ncbi:MAG: hypothetical protein WD529_04965 [Balneolaceae bacterium]